jgi:hypothetical protein
MSSPVDQDQGDFSDWAAVRLTLFADERVCGVLFLPNVVRATAPAPPMADVPNSMIERQNSVVAGEVEGPVVVKRWVGRPVADCAEE